MAVLALGVVGCGQVGQDASGPSGGSSGGYTGGTPSPSGTPSGSASPPGTGAPGSAGPGTGSGIPAPGRPQTGLLTAGTWDDNLNFDFFRQYHQRLRATQSPGLLDAPVSDRLLVLVTDAGGAPMAGARVAVKSAGQEMASTQTGADGRALFFPSWYGTAVGAELEVIAEAGSVRNSLPARVGDALVTLPLGGSPSPVTGLDAAIIIDTTGSMGDEHRYLSDELLNISASIKERFPTVSQRWAFVAYRDYQDEYVTRKLDFTDVSSFKSYFATLAAGGGGDFEEAPERGLAEMNNLGWREGAVARVAFWVGDAPHHNERAAEVMAALRIAKGKGIHIYPISASGTDERLEFSMRLGAMITGGRYLFLTDDSGIGGAHKEPTVPCYRVTTLQKAILRMLQMELTGGPVEPSAADVLRTGGNPSDGQCSLTDGQRVQVL